MITGIIILCIGIFMGWVVIPQPEWAQTFYDWLVHHVVRLWCKHVKKMDVED